MKPAIPLSMLVDPKYVAAVSGADSPDWLNEVGVTEYQSEVTNQGLTFLVSLVPLDEESRQGASIVQFPGFGLLLGPWLDDSLTISLALSDEILHFSVEAPLSLQINPPLFQRVDPVTLERSPDADEGIIVGLGMAAVTADLFLDDQGGSAAKVAVDLEGPISVSDPFMIGETGIILRNLRLHLNFSGDGLRPPNTPSDWTGVYIESGEVLIPALFDGAIGASELGIGTGGLYGTVSYSSRAAPTYDPEAGSFIGEGVLQGDLLGMAVGVSGIDLIFAQSVPTESTVRGKILIPFFDEPVDVEIGLDLDGRFTVRLASDSGLFNLRKPGILSIQLESLAFEVEESGLTVRLSGTITPEFAEFDWPSFEVRELAIDSEGNVRLEGGWLDLPSQYSLDFYGFQLEITQLGFGKSGNGGKWIGFSGGLKLIDALPAGASVEGLRLTWYPGGETQVSFNGVGLEFEVPNVLRFKGEVSYSQIAGGHRFDGDIALDLMALGLELDAKLVVGTLNNGDRFFAIYLGVELPAGIPLGPTGLALYGMAGLFALRMGPNKRDDEEWYDWYQRSEVGVIDLEEKWDPQPGGLALGAGITLGTVTDNGFAFAAKTILVIVFPGPVLLLEGKANLLKKRSKLDEGALFRALAVLDVPEQSYLLSLDAQYKFGDGGQLIDIRGSAEALFAGPDNWHIFLGQREPRDRRLRASIFFDLFEAGSYFMLSPSELAKGASISYGKSWKFGPLKVTLEASIEGNAVVSWRPVHLHGDLWLHGKAELKVFGFGLGLSVDARLSADVFEPFYLLAQLSVGIKLPWFLPSFDVDIALQWKDIQAPQLPLPLQEVAIEHFKVSTSWPLSLTEEPPENLPLVPIDCRPHITFGRSVWDVAGVGGNPQPPDPEFEPIGDAVEGPVKVRYGLEEITLAKWEPSATDWLKVASSSDSDPDTRLHGSWAPVPNLPDSGGETTAQTKLWLWSKTPFDYTRRSTRAWEEWFTRRFPNYPCIPDLPDRKVCCDFESFDPLRPIRFPLRCPDQREITFVGDEPEDHVITELEQPVRGKKQGLCFLKRPGHLTIELSQPARLVEILADQWPSEVFEECIDFSSRGIPGTGTDDNPLFDHEVKFEVQVFDPNNPDVFHFPPHTRFEIPQGILGLNCEALLKIYLPCTASTVTLILQYTAEESSSSVGVPTIVQARNGDGTVVDTTSMGTFKELESLKLTGSGISSIFVYTRQTVSGAETYLHKLCFECLAARRLSAVGFDADDKPSGPFFVAGQVIEVAGDELIRVEVEAKGPACIAEVCAVFPPDPAAVSRRQEMSEHLREEMARWSQTGEVLEPYTTYRLQIQTTVEPKVIKPPEGDKEAIDFSDQTGFDLSEDLQPFTDFAYFRTGGPPGLTRFGPPIGPPEPKEFNSGLDDLTRYVSQTVPPTVPPAGEKPLLPRPVYRAYDVGVVFNENYVDLMYRIAHRDLGLYLYDHNNRPVRDAEGRQLNSRWGETEKLSLSESEQRWLSVVNASGCVTLDIAGIPRQKTLTVSDSAHVMEPDTVYEARLIPVLLQAARLSDITVDDLGSGAPTVYRFGFTTSLFANFFHHLHSFQDETWRAEWTFDQVADAELGRQLTAAVAQSGPAAVSSAENQAYEELAIYALGPAMRQDPPRVEVTRVERGGEVLAFLLRSPEPLDWRRIDLEMLRAELRMAQPETPDGIKLTEVDFGADPDEDQAVILLLRRPTNLTGTLIEFRGLSTSAEVDSGDEVDPPPENSADEPPWETYYAFGSEERWPAGTTVEIRTGAGTDGPAEIAGRVRRHTASDRLLPTVPGAELRLTAADGTVGHRRHFLPGDSHATVKDLRRIRKADGTAVFFLMPGSSAFSAGQYRLRMTYRRNNQAVDSDSTVLSQAGDSSPEEVTIDIPWEVRRLGGN